MRKPDRNGNIIALITYKHVESCDFAIRLFNGIKLFNQSLKVQQSQPGGQIGTKDSINQASASNTPSNQSCQKIYNKKSVENAQFTNEVPAQSLMGLMFMQNQLTQNIQQFSTPQPYNITHLMGDRDVVYRTSRRNERYHHHQHGGGRIQRNSSYHQRDQSYQERDFREQRRSFKRSRSRSPLKKRK